MTIVKMDKRMSKDVNAENLLRLLASVNDFVRDEDQLTITGLMGDQMGLIWRGKKFGLFCVEPEEGSV
jgi:hypothetical protein